MVSTRLIRLIEAHAEQLSHAVAQHIQTHSRTPHFRQFSETEIQHRVRNVYKNLGAWITRNCDEEIREGYQALGRERFHEGVPLHEVIWALALNKNQLLNFVRTEGEGGTALELYGEQELFRLIDHFYDNAIYHTAVGYEQASHPHTAHAA